MYLAILKPFQPGDMVDMALVKGFVRSVSATQTILDQPDGNVIFVPNTKIISSPFTNFTGEQKRAREKQESSRPSSHALGSSQHRVAVYIGAGVLSSLPLPPPPLPLPFCSRSIHPHLTLHACLCPLLPPHSPLCPWARLLSLGEGAD